MFHDIAPRQLDITYENRAAAESDFVICVRDGKVMTEEGEELMLPTVGSLGLTNDKLRFLFAIDEAAFFMPREADLAQADMREADLAQADMREADLPHANMQEARMKTAVKYETPRELRYRKPMWLAYAATLGYRIQEFYRLNAHCGRCGAANIHSDRERAMVCPSCGNTVYPQIAPSVIVLIRNGEETVLTKYQASHSSYRRYALVAGYVESGETPEEAVKREVFEEVGLRVKNISYYKSQPWPISGALLLGFVCDLDGDSTIVRQEDELAVAEWVKREDVPNRAEDVSLTSEMMEMFRTHRL